MYLVRRQNERFFFSLLHRCMNSAKKSYYDVLNVPQTCSDQEIRQAFIRMSKQLHPDKNTESDTHEAFVRLVEAYNVLSKPQSRALYDAREIFAAPTRPSGAHVYRDAAGSCGRKTGERKFYSNFYEYGDKSRDAYNEAKPYYGFTSIKKRSNFAVLAVCLGIAFVGISLQLFIISASFRSGRQLALDKSMRNARELDSVLSAASDNGNEVQAQLLLKKISEASSHTVATATLARTLASASPK